MVKVAMATTTRDAAAHPRIRRFNFFAPEKRCPNRYTPATARVMTAANDKYIRCSNARSAMGMKLDDGARMTKNQTPKNPIAGLRHQAQIVAASNPRITMDCG